MKINISMVAEAKYLYFPVNSGQSCSATALCVRNGIPAFHELLLIFCMSAHSLLNLSGIPNMSATTTSPWSM